MASVPAPSAPADAIGSQPRVKASLTLFLCLFAAQAGLLVLSPILPQIADEFGISTAAAGQLRSVSGLVAGVGALAVIRLARSFGLRDLIAIGLALLAVAALGSAAAPSFWTMIAAQVALGAGIAVVVSAAVAAAGEWEPQDRAKNLSWALVGQPAAWIVGMPLVGLVAVLSWRAAWLALPLTAAAAALVAVSSRTREAPAGRTDAAFRRVLRQPFVRGWAVGELLAYSAWAGTLVFAGALFVEAHGASARLTGFLLAGAAIAYVPGNFLARRLVTGRSALPLAVLAALAAAGVAVFGAFRPAIAVSEGAFAALALVNGARTFAASQWGMELARCDRLVMMSIRTAALQFGYLIGGAVGGLALALGGYAMLGLVLALLFALAAIPHLLSRPRRAPVGLPA